MSTINLNKGGSIIGTVDTTQAAARDEASGTSTAQGTAQNSAVQYFKSTGRGSGTFRYIRSFLQFDSSSITSAVGAAVLNIESEGTSDTADVIVCASDAFGGASDDLINDDFNNVDFSTAYSSEVSTWNDNGANNAITLNAAARTAIQNNNSFICAVVDHDSDFQDTDSLSGNGNTTVGIDFSGTITLVVTLAGYGNDVNLVASANIGEVNNVATANIDKIIGV
tara:strand:- start:1679 stop:2350 length:672 start_codon:yes stop_codon:yes gene_type:complete